MLQVCLDPEVQGPRLPWFSLLITPLCLGSPGLTVVTRSPDSNNVASSTVGTALPKFAIRGMLKTFGLHGVVLDVDSVSEGVRVLLYTLTLLTSGDL